MTSMIHLMPPQASSLCMPLPTITLKSYSFVGVGSFKNESKTSYNVIFPILFITSKNNLGIDIGVDTSIKKNLLCKPRMCQHRCHAYYQLGIQQDLSTAEIDLICFLQQYGNHQWRYELDTFSFIHQVLVLLLQRCQFFGLNKCD